MTSMNAEPSEIRKVRDLRVNNIQEYLIGHHATSKEIAEAVKIPYVTTRRLLVEMEQEKLVVKIGYRHGEGGIEYTSNHIDRMPSFQTFGTQLLAIDILKEFERRARDNGGKFESAGINEAVHNIAAGLSAMFQQVLDYKETTELPTERRVKRIRGNLIKSEAAFKDMLDLIRQMLDSPYFWVPIKMQTLSQADSFDAVTIQRAYDLFTLVGSPQVLPDENDETLDNDNDLM